MGILLLNFIIVILFTWSAHCLLRSVTATMSYNSFNNYSLTARKIERYYKIMAWLLLSLFLFISMLNSFVETFTQIP